MPIGGGEDREIAANEINSAYQQHSTRLDLSDLGLTSLPDKAFEGLNSLEALYLHDNQLNSLPDGVFQGLNRLDTLNLSENELTSLPEKVFEGLNNLRELCLDKNKLSSLPKTAFEGLNSLEALYLNKNELGSLPEKVFEGLNSLKSLHLHENKLSSLPDKAFEGLNSLEYLHLKKNQLSSLPEKVFEGLSRLVSLNLSENKLTSLPDKAFKGLSRLIMLFLSNNELSSLPHGFFQGLSLDVLHLDNNQFVFMPNIPAGTSYYFGLVAYLPPRVEEEFKNGNTQVLDFLLTGEVIPGASSERGRLKLDIMLQHAKDHIIRDNQSTWQHSAVLNQLFYQASVLSNDSAQDLAIKEQAQALLTRYLGTENIQPFAEQAEDIGFAPTKYDALVFINEDGTQGLTIHKDCYEVNILNAPFANKDATHTALANGVLIHNKEQEADLFSSPDQLKPFALINQAYLRQLAKQGVASLLTSINMGDEYQKRFSDVLTVKSVGVLARSRGTTQEEKNNVAPYKMVFIPPAQVDETLFRNEKDELIDPQGLAAASQKAIDEANPALATLNEVFSKLVNTPNLGDRNATITDEHFEKICAAFPGLTEQAHPALLFVLATVFVRYSSAAVFGTEQDSPAPLRFYASALLNKLKQLDGNLFNQINDSGLQDALFADACTDTLAGDMRSLARANPIIRSVYDLVMPEMWK